LVVTLLYLPKKESKLLMRRGLLCMAGLTLAAFSGGCGSAVKTTHTTPPAQKMVAQVATREELVDKYNAIATGVQTFNATVQLKATTGSEYSGVIEDYHEVKAFILAARPAYIRVIGQAPVIGKTIFDMVSDENTFRISIPSKNKFLVGPVALEHSSSKPIENLRPQHLLDAILWSEIRKQESLLFQEFNDVGARYYILTVLRGGYEPAVMKTIWFNRADLQVSRIELFGPKGILLSDMQYSDWEPVAAEPGPGNQAQATQGPAAQNPNGASPNATVPSFPRSIHIDRPHDDYRLDLQITKLALNQAMPPDRFQLAQPAGSELVNVGQDAGDKQQ
jgi:outer membrane lipoprotein-sorting protein